MFRVFPRRRRRDCHRTRPGWSGRRDREEYPAACRTPVRQVFTGQIARNAAGSGEVAVWSTSRARHSGRAPLPGSRSRKLACARARHHAQHHHPTTSTARIRGRGTRLLPVQRAPGSEGRERLLLLRGVRGDLFSTPEGQLGRGNGAARLVADRWLLL